MAERIAGGLLGVAAGDALGVTLEFTPPGLRPSQDWHRDITGGGPFGFWPGEGSDDTDLTWAVTTAIVDAGPDAATDMVVDLAARRMLDWLNGRPRDVGNTTRAALIVYRQSGDTAAGQQVMGEWSAGNGSLMRALPIGLARSNPARRDSEARAISAITHADPRCTDSCAAYCHLAAGLLDGANPYQLIRSLVCSSGLRPDVRRALSTGAATTLAKLRPTGYVLDTLTVGVWAVCQPGPLEDTLAAVVNLGGDADTTGAVAGGLLGACHGVNAIPDRWLERLEYRDRLAAAATQLHRIRHCPAEPTGRPWSPSR